MRNGGARSRRPILSPSSRGTAAPPGTNQQSPLSYRLNQNPEERRARNRARRPLDERRAPAVSVPTREVMRTYEFLPCGRNKARGTAAPPERKRPRKSPSYGMTSPPAIVATPSPATATSGERGRPFLDARPEHRHAIESGGTLSRSPAPKSTPRARARDRTAPLYGKLSKNTHSPEHAPATEPPRKSRELPRRPSRARDRGIYTREKANGLVRRFLAPRDWMHAPVRKSPLLPAARPRAAKSTPPASGG